MESSSIKRKSDSTSYTQIPMTSLSNLSIHSHKSQFPLHYAAKCGRAELLTRLLNEPKADPFVQDGKLKTPLHYAAFFGNHKTSLKCVQVLLNCPQVAGESSNIEIYRNFVDCVDINGETALHLAIKNEAKLVVEHLILEGADVNIKSNDGFEQLELIYKKIPDSLLGILDKAVTVEIGESSDENFELNIDLGAVIGIPALHEITKNLNNEDELIKLPKETELLSYSLNASSSIKKGILSHSLIRLFLEKKWRKVKYIFYSSIAFHIFWLILYTIFIGELYLSICPFNPQKKEEKVQENETLSGPGEELSSENLIQIKNISKSTVLYQLALDDTVCEVGSFSYFLAILIISISIFVGIKEIFQFFTIPRKSIYLKSLENWGVLLMILAIFLSTWPVFSSFKVIAAWQFQIAAFGIFIAWIIILCQIAKLPSLGIYVLILEKVFKSFSLFILTFASLFVAFALTLKILLPGKAGFNSSFPLSLIQILVMMTGELNYVEVFHEEDGDLLPFPLLGHFFYCIFIILVTIILFNLLIGMTVNDIQGLQTNADLSRLNRQLQRIFLVESFLFSDKLQFYLEYFNKRHILERFLLISPRSVSDLSIKVYIKRIPQELQKEFRRLAAQNETPEDEEDEGKTLKNIEKIKKMKKCKKFIEELLNNWEYL